MPILAIDPGATKIHGAIINANKDFLDKSTCMVKNRVCSSSNAGLLGAEYLVLLGK